MTKQLDRIRSRHSQAEPGQFFTAAWIQSRVESIIMRCADKVVLIELDSTSLLEEPSWAMAY